MNTSQAIIKFCLQNHVSTTEASDALDKSGVFGSVKPINSNIYCVGHVKCVFAANNSNWELHDQLIDINEGDIVVIFTRNIDNNRSVIGELVSKYILLYKQAAAIVVQGSVRDYSALRRSRYPIWSTSTSPLGCFNHTVSPYPVTEVELIKNDYENAIAICDDGGVVIIKSDQVTEHTLERIRQIEVQEDIWFFCLDTLKWNTKDIVCDKRYLDDTDSFSRVHRSYIDSLKEKPSK